MGGFDGAREISLHTPERRGRFRQPAAEPEVSPDETVIDDNRAETVTRVQEQAARTFSAYQVHVPAGGYAQVIGADTKRSRVILSNVSADGVIATFGTMSDAQGGRGFPLLAGSFLFEPQITDGLWVSAPAASEILIGVWIEAES